MVSVENMWGDPSRLPGPPRGGLRTREDSESDRAPLIALFVIVLALIVVPPVLATVVK